MLAVLHAEGGCVETTCLADESIATTTAIVAQIAHIVVADRIRRAVLFEVVDERLIEHEPLFGQHIHQSHLRIVLGVLAEFAKAVVLLFALLWNNLQSLDNEVVCTLEHFHDVEC